MKQYEFELSSSQLESLLTDYPNMGKNSHVGNLAVKVTELFFKREFSEAKFKVGRNGADLEVHHNDRIEQFEIKGTVDEDISWSKLKVSSKDCHQALLNGMTLIRVTKIGQAKMILYFMKHGEDFELVPEERWAVKPKKKK